MLRNFEQVWQILDISLNRENALNLPRGIKNADICFKQLYDQKQTSSLNPYLHAWFI